MTKKNPWLGLASYEEPKNDGNDYLFCGRDEETLDVVRLIDNNLFITLYGSSGVGKTSLLRAGVMPILRRKDYFPIYVRLLQEPKEISYAEAIVRKLQSSGLTEESIAEMKHPDGNDRLYLWNYFAITRFFNEGREVYPVIILDQFEEVFREGDKAKAELLLKQIYLLLNDELEITDEAGYSADTNYRFVASIREDFLFVLEDSIDENSLDLYKNNRYRLRPMKPEQAKRVVRDPGKECINEMEIDTIEDLVISVVNPTTEKEKRNEIDPLLLSLVCAMTYDKKKSERIRLSDFDMWKNEDASVNKTASNYDNNPKTDDLWKKPMEVYYHYAVKDLPDDKTRYIQQNLISEDGNRKRVEAEKVKAALGEAIYDNLKNGEYRLITDNKQGQVELLHDQLGMVVYEDRKNAEKKELKRKKRKKQVRNVGIIVSFVVMGIFIFQFAQYKKMEKKMKENHARFIASIANSLANEDAALAAALAYEVLPDNANKNHSSNLYTYEADFALRKALAYEGGSKLLNVRPIALFPDGERLLAHHDNNLYILELENFTCIQTIEGSFSSSQTIAISQDCKRIAVQSKDYKEIFIIDIATNCIIDSIPRSGLEFSLDPSGTHLAEAEQNNINIYGIYGNKGVLINSIGLPSMVQSVSYSPSGKWIIAGCDKGIFIYDNTTKLCVDTLLGYDKNKYCNSVLHDHAEFDLMEKTIITYSTLYPNRFFLWKWDSDAAKGDSVDMRALPEGTVNSLSFSSDGNYIVLRNRISPYDSIRKGFINESYIHVWNKQTSNPIRSIKKIDKGLYFSFFESKNDRIISFGDNNGKYYAFIDYNKNDNNYNILSDTLLFYSNNRLYNHNRLNSATFSPNGKHILAAAPDGLLIINAQTGQRINSIPANGEKTAFASYSPDGILVAYSSDNTLSIYDSLGNNSVFIKQFCNNIHSVSFSPNGKSIFVFTGYINCDTCFNYDISTGKKIGAYRTSLASEIHFNHKATDGLLGGGTRFRPGSYLHVSDKKNSNPVSWYPNPSGTLIFSPDDKYIAVIRFGDIAVFQTKIWEKSVKSESEWIPDFKVNGNYLNLNYHPTGKFLIAVSGSGNIHIFASHNGIELCRLYSGNSKAKLASFSPDGKKILSLHWNNTIRVWDFPPLQDLIDQTRERLKDRPLTAEERRMYYLE